MEVKTVFPPDLADQVREAARGQSMSVAQFLREAAMLKVRADQDGIGFFRGRWVKQRRFVLDEDSLVFEGEENRVVR
ncbi:MAG TPA: hypothetical protein VGK96_28610 [Candidatus Sulfotelmatobacter sp.]|jgi:hypothetical protein